MPLVVGVLLSRLVMLGFEAFFLSTLALISAVSKLTFPAPFFVECVIGRVLRQASVVCIFVCVSRSFADSKTRFIAFLT